MSGPAIQQEKVKGQAPEDGKNAKTHMMNWLYEDALLLKNNDRKKGCLCLLLCLIDALAKKK